MTALTSWINTHRKIITAIVGLAISLIVQKWGTSQLWVTLVIDAATALGFYSVPDAPKTATPPPAAPAAVPPPAK